MSNVREIWDEAQQVMGYPAEPVSDFRTQSSQMKNVEETAVFEEFYLMLVLCFIFVETSDCKTWEWLFFIASVYLFHAEVLACF